MTRSIVYGSWNDGSDIYKDKKGFYVEIFKSNADWEANKLTKKYLPNFKPTSQNELEKELALIRSKTKRRQSKKRRTTKKRHVKK
jgi:hypothetical protein